MSRLLRSFLVFAVSFQTAFSQIVHVPVPVPVPLPMRLPRNLKGSRNKVHVTVGEPSIWSLEQAHYLLQRDRERNRNLKAADLGDLNANETNVNRVDLLRSLFQLSVEVNRAQGIKNDEARNQYGISAGRRVELERQQDEARATLRSVQADLAVQKKKSAAAAANSQEKKDADAHVAELTDEATTLKGRIDDLEKSLTTLRAGPELAAAGTGTAPANFTDFLSKDVLTAMLSDIGASTGSKLAASVRLDNYVQMQQELVAKALTLLRDEAGPDHRVLFLELPQSIWAAQGGSDHQVAQTWWRMDGVYLVEGDSGCVQTDTFTEEALCQQVRPMTAQQMLKIVKSGESIGATPKPVSSYGFRELQGARKKSQTGSSGPTSASQALVNELKVEFDKRKAALVAAKASLRKVMDEIDKEQEANKKSPPATAAEITKAKAELDQVEATLAKITTRMDAAERAVAEAKSEIAEKDRLLRKAESESKNAVEQKDKVTIEKEIRNLKREIKDLEGKKIARQRESGNAAGQLGVIQPKADSLRSKYEALNRNTEEARKGRLETLNAERQKRQEEVDKQEPLEREARQHLRRVERALAANRIDGLQSDLATAEKREQEKEKAMNAAPGDDGKRVEWLKAARELDTARGDLRRAYEDLKGAPVNATAPVDDREVRYVALGKNSSGDKVKESDFLARTVELIPRQSAVNVDEVRARLTRMGFSGAFKGLTFGAKGDYERNRERLEQVTYQEAFAWGFGKGAPEFGWTFGSMPGMKALNSGVRTTYAVVVVPKDAKMLQMSARGCWMGDRGLMPPRFPEDAPEPVDRQIGRNEETKSAFAIRDSDALCSESKVFSMRIPETTESFLVNRVSYLQTKQGERTTVSIFGEGFSPQMQVLVKGVPLERPLRMSDITKIAPSKDGVEGAFEWVNSQQIVLSFSMGPDFHGTPPITLISPVKSATVNFLQGIHVNNHAYTSLYEHGKKYEIFKQVKNPQFDITAFRPFALSDDFETVDAWVLGKGFDVKTVLSVGGKPLKFALSGDPDSGEAKLESPASIRVKFERPSSGKWTLTGVEHETLKTKVVEIDDPFPPFIETCKVANASTDEGGQRVVELEIGGKYFNGEQKMTVKDGDEKTVATFRVASGTQAYVRLVNPGGYPKRPLAKITSGGKTRQKNLDTCTAFAEAKTVDFVNGTAQIEEPDPKPGKTEPAKPVPPANP